MYYPLFPFSLFLGINVIGLIACHVERRQCAVLIMRFLNDRGRGDCGLYIAVLAPNHHR
jgi:hypothetical protein